ncbi:hypothetical protein [Pseudorhodoferax sp. Leaf274]|nr:hypothetical protein [Pseudorhodoferax sp. Leaf274]
MTWIYVARVLVVTCSHRFAIERRLQVLSYEALLFAVRLTRHRGELT